MSEVTEGDVLRRVLVSRNWVDQETGRVLPNAFRAESHDTEGISVSQSSLRTPEEEGKSGRNPAGYHVAEVPVGKAISSGATVVGSPIEENPAHAHIPQLTYANRKDDKSIELRQALADAVSETYGPFVGEVEV